MTHIIDGTEHLDAQEMRIYRAVRRLSAQGRTTNNSQIAADTGIGRTTVGFVTSHLKARGFLKDVSSGAAYHWRVTTRIPPERQPERSS
jgi:hypothetical protein